MFNTREIDRVAQNTFKDSIPPGWLPRKQDPDIHIDYFVEIADMLEPSGVIFGVQLKGTMSPNYSNEYIKISMKTQHIKYYLDKVKQPIFIVTIDVKYKRGYYIFIQEWAKRLDIEWREQKKIAIKIPIENSLDNNDNFREEIKRADKYMRDLWPSSIPAAVNYEIKRLENLDPRFKVSISQSDGIINYGIRAKEKVNCKLYFKNPEHFQKGFRDFVDRGLPFTLDTTDILKVEGSELIKEAFGKSLPGKLTIEPERKNKASCIISTVNDLNEETSLLYEISGIMVGGWKEVRFQGGLDGTPLKVNLVCDLTKQATNEIYHFDMTFKEYNIWEGTSVSLLPYFEKLFSLFKAMKDGNIIKMICEIKGNRIFAGKFKMNENEYINHILECFNIINKVRQVADKTYNDIIMMNIESIKVDEMNIIELIYAIVDKGEYRHDGSNTIFRAIITPNDNFYEMISKRDTEINLSQNLVIEVQEPIFTIFGKEIKIAPLKYTLTFAKIIVTDTDELNDNKKIKLMGTEKSELIVTKI